MLWGVNILINMRKTAPPQINSNVCLPPNSINSNVPSMVELIVNVVATYYGCYTHIYGQLLVLPRDQS